jgi:hypothetical protein
MDHHTVAAISITGTCLDVLGSLYLAYDLLGGQHSPLRLLTRAVTYSIVFGVGYGLGLGPVFGLAAGITTGVTLAIELNRAARGLLKDSNRVPDPSTLRRWSNGVDRSQLVLSFLRQTLARIAYWRGARLAR